MYKNHFEGPESLNRFETHETCKVQIIGGRMWIIKHYARSDF